MKGTRAERCSYGKLTEAKAPSSCGRQEATRECSPRLSPDRRATIVSRSRLQSLFPGNPGQLDEALAVLRAHRLIVEEKDLILALPVAAPLPSGVQPAMIGAQPMVAA